VVVLDNAPIHHSHLFIEQIPKWGEKGLFLYYLPTYSPELNKIEILWRMIKYKWISISAYFDFDALKSALDDILIGIGEKYKINFA